jgi:predicted DsbA family dithiol-disulfide isomerase
LLQPDRPPQGAPRPLREGETETELSPAWRERAGELGLLMRRPQWSPNTRPAHEATIYAREKGLDSEFHHVTARAYWEAGANLGDLAVLQKLTEECGLDWNELGPRLEAGHYRQQVLDQYQDARSQGVSGTPTYRVAGAKPVFGDLSVDQLRELIKGG